MAEVRVEGPRAVRTITLVMDGAENEAISAAALLLIRLADGKANTQAIATLLEVKEEKVGEYTQAIADIANRVGDAYRVWARGEHGDESGRALAQAMDEVDALVAAREADRADCDVGSAHAEGKMVGVAGGKGK